LDYHNNIRLRHFRKHLALGVEPMFASALGFDLRIAFLVLLLFLDSCLVIFKSWFVRQN